ncbi:MAG: GNAT family N-acetyltransferase [Thermoanaerobacterales bacterium]|nr:GNAT family N-acetyltransferase [Thermoanaerobacterales bacterium]
MNAAPGYRLRTAEAADLPAINRIFNHAVEHSVAAFCLCPMSDAERQDWFEAHGGNHPVLVVEHGENVVAWGALSPYSLRDGYRFTVEDSIYVDRDHRGRGLGTLLLGALLNAAADRGHHTVIALIESENAVSIHLHRRFGFVEAGRLREVGHKFGRWLDVTIMQRLLDAGAHRAAGHGFPPARPPSPARNGG